jgi:hypothetical protein
MVITQVKGPNLDIFTGDGFDSLIQQVSPEGGNSSQLKVIRIYQDIFDVQNKAANNE